MYSTKKVAFSAEIEKDWKFSSYLTKQKRRYTAPISLYNNHHITFRLLLSGDVELNPGPNQRNVCNICEKTIRKNSSRFDCAVCKDSTHVKCTKINTPHRLLHKINQWTCYRCFSTELPFHNERSLYIDRDAETHDELNVETDNILNQHRQHLSIAHLNTQSISSTFVQFEAMLLSYKFDLITLSETWLKDNKNLLDSVDITGYKKDFRNRDRIKGGGVGYYIKENIKMKDRKDLDRLDSTIEHQWIELTGKNKTTSTLIGILYQPSSKSQDKIQFLEKFETLLSEITILHHGPVIITGDFNIDLLVNSPERTMYENILSSFNLTQHVTRPTRKSKSLIDHIATTQNLKLIHSDIVYCDEISDHDSPFCIFKASKMTYEPRYKFIRDERKLNMNEFINDFRYLPLNVVYAFDSVSDKVNVLNQLITDCIDNHAPIRRVKLTRPPAPWMKDLRIGFLQTNRNRLRRKVKRNHNEMDYQELKATKNQLKSAIKQTKRAFVKKLLSNKNSSETWKVINKVLHPSPKAIKVDPDETNEFFNQTAIRTTGKEASEIKNSFIYDLPENPNAFNLHEVSYQDVEKAIKKLHSPVQPAEMS